MQNDLFLKNTNNSIRKWKISVLLQSQLKGFWKRLGTELKNKSNIIFI